VQEKIICSQNSQIFWDSFEQIKHKKQSFFFKHALFFKNGLHKWQWISITGAFHKWLVDVKRIIPPD
jgi:hypothetical protein